MKRINLVILILVMIMGGNNVSFAHGRVILALGDSVTAGYGLKNREEECFVSLVAQSGDHVINKAVDGNEAPDIINQLTDEENDNYISEDDIINADVVTVTCGGNDMMELLYEKIAKEYSNVHPRKKKITADEVLGILAQGDVYAIAAAIHTLDKEHEAYYMNDGDFNTRLNDFAGNLLWITDYIRNLNPGVRIIVATQYNPYVEFKDLTTFGVLYYGMEEGATRLNDAIRENAEAGGYEVCDVKDAFDRYPGYEDLYNATADIDNLNLDFHPSKEGHALIAREFGMMIYNVHRLGNEMPDGTYKLPKEVLGYYITDADGDMRFVDAGEYEAHEGDITEEVYMNVNLLDGAQVKKSGKGLRFIATVDRSGFDAEGYGMRITADGSEEEIFVDALIWQNDTIFTVAIENIEKENYKREYTVSPFVKVRYDDGREKTVVGEQRVTRSIKLVAEGLLENGKIDEETRI
ncbi:MAG: SGNH/GDSL hydrolase family protein, partial [Clostridia bacterium]|nr:SGNH/GDSL hydrolase family protein [Clostridia bacterium]